MPRLRSIGLTPLQRFLPILSATVVLAVLAAGAPAAPSSARLVKGIYDETQVLYGNPDRTFPMLKQLGTKAIRVNLYWGGRFGASIAPPSGLSPEQPENFDWSLYDRVVTYAARFGIQVYFSIYGTPDWANADQGLNVPPRQFKALENFAFIAATRYGGRFFTDEGIRLPAVTHWIAWNEPNNPLFLKNQFKRRAGRWVIQSAIDYAKICNAVVAGVRRARIESGARRSQVACGVTGPRGNNIAASFRPSVSPIPFVRAMKAAGATGFDAYAHHPYYGNPSETPSTPPSSRQAITLGNIDVLIAEVTRLWGAKRIWITEYGYQTNPPDRVFGVPPKTQAKYLAQAWAIAKKNPRIDTFFWFLLRDENRLQGWQSGLLNKSSVRKPSFSTFRALR